MYEIKVEELLLGLALVDWWEAKPFKVNKILDLYVNEGNLYWYNLKT